MASKQKKMLLCCVLFLILGVIGSEDSKEVGKRVSEEEAKGGRGEEWFSALRDRTGVTEGSKEEGEGKEEVTGGERKGRTEASGAREGKRGDGGDLIEEKGGRESTTGVGGGWGGRRREKLNEGGKITDEIESEESEDTTDAGNESGKREKLSREEKRRCEGGCEEEGGRRDSKQSSKGVRLLSEVRREREEGDIPQTRNPKETNEHSRRKKSVEPPERERTGKEGCGERKEEPFDEGKEDSTEGLKKEKGGERAKGKDKTRSEWWKRLSRNEPNPAHEGGKELERELREAEKETRRRKGERRGEYPEEERGGGDVEEELLLMRGEEKRKRWREAEGIYGTDRKKKFRFGGVREGGGGKPPRYGGREGGERCGYATSLGGGREGGGGEMDVGGKEDGSEEEAPRGWEGGEQHATEGEGGREREGAVGTTDRATDREANEDAYVEEKGEWFRRLRENAARGERGNPNRKVKKDDDDAKTPRLGRAEIEEEKEVQRRRKNSAKDGQGEKRREAGSVINFERDYEHKEGAEEEKRTEVTAEKVGERKIRSGEDAHRHQSGIEMGSRGEETTEKRKTKTVPSETLPINTREEDELEAELRGAEKGRTEEYRKDGSAEKTKERADTVGCVCGKGAERCEDANGNTFGREEEDPGRDSLVRGGSSEEPSGKRRKDRRKYARGRSPYKVAPEVNFERGGNSGKNEYVNREPPEDLERVPEEGMKAREEEEEERDGGNVGRDVAFEKEPERAAAGGEKIPIGLGYNALSGRKTKNAWGQGDTDRSKAVDLGYPPKGDAEEAAGERTNRKESSDGTEMASDVIDVGSEIEFPNLMEAETRRRLKGEEGEAWPEGEGETSAEGRGRAGDWLSWRARFALEERGNTVTDSGKNGPPPSRKNDKETGTFLELNKGSESMIPSREYGVVFTGITTNPQVLNDPEGIIYEREIESLKSSKKTACDDDGCASDEASEDAVPARDRLKHLHDAGEGDSEIAIETSQAADGGVRKAGYGVGGSAADNQDDAPVVVSEVETDSKAEFIGKANHPISLPTPEAIGNSMLPRIPEVNANVNSRAESNPSRPLEATAATPKTEEEDFGDRSGDAFGVSHDPKGGGGRGVEMVGEGKRASVLSKNGTLKDSDEDERKVELASGEEVIKGPRRILMSVTEETGGKKAREEHLKGEENGEAMREGHETHLGERDDYHKDFEHGGIFLFQGPIKKIGVSKGNLQSGWTAGKGIKFIARREEGNENDVVYASEGTRTRGKSIRNSSLLVPLALGKGTRNGGKSGGGIALGDKYYHRGKGGLLAVSMGGKPTKASVRHASVEESLSNDVPKGGIYVARKPKSSDGENSNDVKSKIAKNSSKGSTIRRTSKGQGSEDGLADRRVSKGERRLSRQEIGHWKRGGSRSGKKSTTSNADEVHYLGGTTVSSDEGGSLEAPPTLPTETGRDVYATILSEKDGYTEDDRSKSRTTVPTPAEEEVGLLKWNSNAIDILGSASRIGCERRSDGEYYIPGNDCTERAKGTEGGDGEEHLGYTRLQVRKPRMLDASGFGRGRGSGGVGGSVPASQSSGSGKKGSLTVGMILPHIAFGQREYTRSTNTAIIGLQKSKVRKLDFFKKYSFSPQQVRSVMMQLTPSPTAILNSLCKEFLSVNVSAILYLMNYEKYGRSTASAQYFLQLAGYLGIPVIAWNADNSGLERRASQSSLQLQLAPSLEHQTAAMLSILERYKWHQFSIVTSQIAGHDDFVQAVRERILDMQDVFKFTILNDVLVTKPSDLSELVNSESRVVLLYCTREEALRILSAAADYKITGENYVWVAAQSVIENRQPLPQFPIGMLGVHFDTSMSSLVTEIATAVKVYAYGVEDFVNDPRNEKLSLNTQLSCEGAGDSRWKVGDRFFKYLRNVSVEGEHGKPNIEFTADGVLKAAELKIMNLRPGVSKQLVWEEIGVWKSWEREGLDIKDIVWPGGSHTPPQGVPEKFHMRITFLEEPPYINVAPPDPITGKCSINRGVLCRFAAETDMSGLDVLQAHRNASYYQCCSGFCIDLLEKFSEELGFTYELVRVEDGKWGTLENGKWNGLIADLINRKTDMVMTSLMINSDREAVVDFTVPFMESGIAIVVAKRTGIISPTAFLEPFDTASWMLVGFVAIQVSAFTIFLFEWLSPSGFNMKVAPSTNHRFSLFRTYWLVWAVLFQAAVHVDCPKGFTARFMTNVWAMFAVVFLAIYTANLAAFMITREEFHEFSGIDDHRLAKPFSHKPMFKFGTIPWGHTDSTLKKYFREMHAYMKRHNRSIVGEGIEAVLSGELDAFVYDGTVLDYLVSQDEDCRLLTVGSWYAMTGYGLAFQRNSKYVRMFNKRLLDFRENGDLERLRRYWMTGSCKPGKQERKSSDPLALEQFLSAFLLLMSGILLAAFLLLLEHLYFKYVRHHLARTDRGGCCALVSLSMGKSLTFRGAVFEAQDMYRNNRRGPQPHQHTGGHRAFTGGGRNCNCSYCEGLHTLWATRRELEACRLRIRHLEKQMEAHGIRPLPPPPPQSLPSLLPLPGSSPGNRRYLNDDDALRTRDMTRNHVSSTEYCGQIYRPCRTEIAEMETVL